MTSGRKHVSKYTIVILIVESLSIVQCSCPSSCNCRWKKGKESVECRRKGLLFLPPNIERGTQVLDLSENRFVHLQSGVFANSKLINLQKIFLASCNLKFIHPHALRQLNNLIELDLSHNSLRDVPKNIFFHTPKLQQLSMAGNLIYRIHNGDFDHTEGLRFLDISDCLINYIELKAFKSLRYLHKLRLNGNKLKIFPSQLIFSLHQLHGIDLHENPWTCNCHLLPMRRWLSTIGHSQSPMCHLPERITGRLFSSLQLSDFACLPKTLPTKQSIRTDSGSNVSFWCPVDGIPPPAVSWFLGDTLLINNTLLGKSDVRINVFDFNANGHGSWLVLSGVTMKNAHLKIKCIASNPAGAASTVFALNVSPSYKILMGLTWTQLIWTSITMMVILVLASCVLFLRWRSSTEDAPYKSQYNNGTFIGETESFDQNEANLLTDSDIDDMPFDTLLVQQLPTTTYSAISFNSTKIHSNATHKSLLHTSNSANILWQPQQAIAMLDSAAPENIIDNALEYSPCSSILSKRKSFSTQRFSLVPEYHKEAEKPISSTWCTLPRNNRCKEQPVMPNTHFHSNELHPVPFRNDRTDKERRYSQPNPEGRELVIFSPSRPVERSVVSCSSHGKISSMVTHRNSPDEGFQEL